jgi:hypothetical protein
LTPTCPKFSKTFDSHSKYEIGESEYINPVLPNIEEIILLLICIKSGHGISMYFFPKDAKVRKICTVRLTTDGFQPSQYTKLCERHFEKDQFAVNPELAVPIGFLYKPGFAKY